MKKPSLSEILGGAAMTLATEVTPHLEAVPYARGHAAVAAMLMILAAQEAEWAVDALHREIEALRALLSEGLALSSPPLAAEIAAALARPAPSSLRVSALADEAAALKGALIALHAHLESVPTGAALEARVLAHLAETATVRVIMLPPI